MTGDAIIIIDADLQDPPELIPDMIEKWEQGYEVIYGKRKKEMENLHLNYLQQRLFIQH